MPMNSFDSKSVHWQYLIFYVVSYNFDWRNAVGLRHLPAGTHSLAPRPGSLVRLAFQNFCILILHSALICAHGRTCTDTVRVLSAPSLHWTTWAKLVPREGFPPPTSPF